MKVTVNKGELEFQTNKKNCFLGFSIQKFIGIGFQIEKLSISENSLNIIIPFINFYFGWYNKIEE